MNSPTTKSPNFSSFHTKTPTTTPVRCNQETPLAFSAFAKPVIYSLFYIAIGVCPVIGFFHMPHVANVAVLMEVFMWGDGKRGGGKGGEGRKNGHLYSGYTERLLEKVFELIQAIREAREGWKDVEFVEEKLKDVKMRKNELQDEIMEGLYAVESVEGREGELEQLAENFTREEQTYVVKAQGEVSEEVKGKFSQLEKYSIMRYGK